MDLARGSSPRADDVDDAETAPRPIVCAACGAALTTEAEIIAVDGAHTHTFANLVGVVFTIRCFAKAPGVSAVGRPSAFFTWFPGSAWQIVRCAACAIHLGWSFTGRATFVALIAERIRA